MTLTKAVEVLRDRRAWLLARLRGSGGGMTHDAAEIGALRLALRSLEREIDAKKEAGLPEADENGIV